MKLIEQRRAGTLFFVYNWGYTVQGMLRYFPATYGMLELACSHEEIRWFQDETAMVAASRIRTKAIFENTPYFNLLLTHFHCQTKLVQDFCLAHGAKRPSRFSLQELVDILASYDALEKEFYTATIALEPVGFALTKMLEERLRAKKLPTQEAAEALQALSSPLEESFARENEKSLLAIAAQARGRSVAIIMAAPAVS